MIVRANLAIAPHVNVNSSKSPAPRQVPVSFRGHVSVSGSTVTTTNLTGTIGRDHFTGYGTGTTSGTIFQGGDVYLSNSKPFLWSRLENGRILLASSRRSR